MSTEFTAPQNTHQPSSREMSRAARPLLAAGFTTAFGAHAVAANLGVYTGSRHGSLLELGILLALYDGAEVVLKPVFGSVADRFGGKPVLIGGLIAFALASAGFWLATGPAALFAARLGQGAAAAAFSPAASMLVARLAPKGGGLGFAALAATAAPDRLGATLGAAEVGRELGDAGGPLIVGLVGAVSLPAGLGALAVLLGADAAVGALRRTSRVR